MLLEKKVMLISGGATAMGQATALACAKEGATVVIVDINEEDGQKTAALAYTADGIRVNALCPRVIHTPIKESYQINI